MLDVTPFLSPHVFSCPSGLIANTIRVKTGRLCRAMIDWASYFARQDARFAELGIEISEIGGLAIYRCPRTSFYSQVVEFRDSKRQSSLRQKAFFLT